MYLGDLDTALAKAFPKCPPPTSAEYRAWLAQYDQIRATIDQYTAGGTRYNRTTKYGLLRSALYKHLESKPISQCEIDAYKRGRVPMSDAQAMAEIRRGWKVLSKEWKDRATHADRAQIIKIAAIAGAVVSAGVAAAAAAGAAAASGAATSGVITAGAKAAAASALGIEGGASMSVQQLGITALKKLAISKGTEYALNYAASEFAKRSGKQADAAALKELEKELQNAQAEYDSLRAKGVASGKAANLASASGGGGGIFPLSLIALAVKAAMK